MLVGKSIILFGIAIIIVGVLIMAAGRLGINKIPGDIVVRRGTTTFFFPIVSCIVLSVVLTLLMRFFVRR